MIRQKSPHSDGSSHSEPVQVRGSALLATLRGLWARARAVRWQAVAPAWVEVGLTVALAVFLADAIWTLATPLTSGGASPVGTTAFTGRGSDQGPDLGILTRYDPFHRTASDGAEAVAEDVAEAAAVETDLDLRLTGVRVSETGSVAIIRKRNGEPGR